MVICNPTKQRRLSSTLTPFLIPFPFTSPIAALAPLGSLLKCLCVVGLLLIGGGFSPASADWLMDCGNCHCKWNSGKKTADCRNLSLSGVPENLSSELQVLDLSHNRIPYLEQNAFLAAELQNLHKLFIRNSSLQQINPRSFTQLEILIELDLSNNLLRELQPNVFVRLIKVRALVLNGNLLQSLNGGVFHNLKYLHKIELKHNRLMRIDAQAFVGVPLLSQIYLDGNQLNVLRKESFESLKRLTALSLDQNPWNCTCELQLFRDFVLKQNLYTPPTACYYPVQLRSMLWIEDQPQAFACKPRIIYPARGASINTSKENVTLVCRVHGSPNTVIAWDYNKQLYRSESALQHHHHQQQHQRVHIQMVREEQSKDHQQFGRDIFISRLTILGAEKSDEGIYTCLAENAGGKDAVQMSLLVQKPGQRDLLLHSNLFVVICLMALGLLSVSVLLSMVTCCIYRRFKQLHPSQHAHLRQLNLSPQQLAGTGANNPGGNGGIGVGGVAAPLNVTGGTEVLLDSVSAVENTSLSNFKHHKASDREGPEGEMTGQDSKYVDVIMGGTHHHHLSRQSPSPHSVVGYLEGQAMGADSEGPSMRLQRDRNRDGSLRGDSQDVSRGTQFLEQKSEDKLNAKFMQTEISRSSTRSFSRGDSSTGGRHTSILATGGEYRPDLLPTCKSQRGSGEDLPSTIGHNPRSKYNINVQEYLQTKYGSVRTAASSSNNNNNSNNKQQHQPDHSINGNGEQAMAYHTKREAAPSIPLVSSTSLTLAETQARNLQRHCKSLPMAMANLRSQPTDNNAASYEYRQPPPPPYSSVIARSAANATTSIVTLPSPSPSPSSPSPSMCQLTPRGGIPTATAAAAVRKQLL
ncbi:uncharacterized protein kek4 [Drosophila tropicalis]|uniref:uncharacterized protein kek4 n=1 Tax=Drosophila tropicalis TaxID=46794 RepID=UPI0035AB949A